MENLFCFVSKNTLKKPQLILMCILFINHIYSQNIIPNENIKQINRSLKVLSTPSPEIPGGYRFNNSYEGLKGGPCLFDDFISVNISVKEIEYYLSIEANIDLKNNTVLYKDPETGQLYSIPSYRVVELIVECENDTLVFKTTEDKIFETNIKEVKFIQVLKEGPNEFVKIPYKIFVPSDYMGAYTANRRYDEYKTEYSYYIKNSDLVYKQIKLTKNSLIKVFPDKREIIKRSFKMKTQSNKEEITLSILKNL